MSLAGSSATRPWRLLGLAITALAIVLGTAGAGLMILRLDDVFLALSEPIFWPAPHAPHELSEDTRLGQSIGFGFWAGLSLTQSMLLWSLPDRPLVPVARALLAGHVLWYVLDSAGSVAAGAHINAVTNTLYAVALGVVLWRLGRESAADAT